MESAFSAAAAAALPLVAAAVIAGLCITAWLARPRRVAEVFRRQGIDGPPPSSFLAGNLPEMKARVAAAASAAADGEEAASGGGGGVRDFEKDGFDDYCTRIFPYFHKWRKAYGASNLCDATLGEQACASARQQRAQRRPAMSETGDAAPARHNAGHGRRRRVLIWVSFAVLVLMLVAAAAAITALAVLRPRDPTTELLSVNATGATPRVAALPTVSIQLNFTFLLVVRVRNPNPAEFRHGAASTTLLYRGAEVGAADVPAGTVPSRGSATLRLNMTVQADRVVAAAGVGGLLGDVLAGEMEFEARTEVRGRVKLLGFVRRSAVARSLCRVVIGVADVKVRRQECHNESKL